MLKKKDKKRASEDLRAISSVAVHEPKKLI